MPLSISSAAFSDGQQIPSRYCKDAGNVSPLFEWRDVPAATRSFALIMEGADVSKGPFRHWAAYNIPADTRHWTKAPAQRHNVCGSVPRQMTTAAVDTTGDSHRLHAACAS
jgi:phosphatidylethanolamine-binding protein (PEBP) family uncharacterized protein